MGFFLAYLLKTSIESDSPYFLEYLTVWGLISLVIYFTWSAITVTYTFVRITVFDAQPHKSSFMITKQELSKPPGCCGDSIDSTSWYHKVLWIMFTISTEIAVGITVLFWTVLYNPDWDIGDNDIAIHLLNGLLAYLDLWITGFPVRIYHFYLVTLFACVYSTFTGIHYASLVAPNITTPIYPVLDYGAHPFTGVAFATVGPLVLGPGIHLFFYGSYLLREGLLFIVKKRLCRALQDRDGDSYFVLKEGENREEKV